MRRSRLTSLLVICLAVVLLSMACSPAVTPGPTSSGAAKSTVEPASSGAAAKPAASLPLGQPVVKIGVQGAASSSHGDYGRQILMGATLATEEINDAGGILGSKIDLLFRDEELKADVAVKNARYMVTEWGANFLVGVDSSGDIMAVAPVAEELKTIMIATHAATHRYTEELVYEKGMKHNFRMSAPIYQDAIIAALIVKDRPEVKRIANIGADYEYGRVGWDMFKETLKKYRPDVEFVGEAWAPFETVDFAPHISAVMAKNPDMIFATPWAGEAVQLLKQALLMGAFEKVKFWWQAMGASVDVLEGITLDAKADRFKGKLWATGRYIFNWPNTPENTAFVERFQKHWSRYPNYSAETTYSAIYAIKAALEKTKTLDSAANIKALEGLEMTTPAGKRVIRAEDHQAVYNVPAGRVAYDDKYPIASLTDLVVVPADEYYRKPPFK